MIDIYIDLGLVKFGEPEYVALKKAYQEAIHNQQDVFEFGGRQFAPTYAEMVLSYYADKFDG